MTSKNGKTRTGRDRKNLGHSDAALAVDDAEAFCKQLAKGRLLGSPDAPPLTLGELFE